MPDKEIMSGFKLIIIGEAIFVPGVWLSVMSCIFHASLQEDFIYAVLYTGAAAVLAAYIFILAGSGRLGKINVAYRQCVVSVRASMILWLIGKAMREIPGLCVAENDTLLMFEGFSGVLIVSAMLILCVFVIYTVIPKSKAKYLRRLKTVIILIFVACVTLVISWNYSGNTTIESGINCTVGMLTIPAVALHLSIVGSILKHEINQNHIDGCAGND